MFLIKELKFQHFLYKGVKRKDFPNERGVYVMYKRVKNEIIILYIGIATSFSKRMSTHFVLKRAFNLLNGNEKLYVGFSEIKEQSIIDLEKDLITKYKPL